MTELANAAAKAAVKMNKAWTRFDKSRAEYNRLGAEYARLALLEIAERYPEITGFTCEVEYVYDDEGGTYPSVEISPVYDDDLLEAAQAAAAGWLDPQDEISDGMQVSEGELSVLQTANPASETLTLAELKGACFDG